MSICSELVKYSIRNCDNDIYDFTSFDSFLSSKDISYVTKNGNHVLHFLAAGQSNSLLKHILPLVKHFIDYRNNYGDTPLQIACAKGSINTVRTLIYNGAKWNVLDIHGNNILHIAIESENMDIIKYLVTRKTSLLNQTNENNKSPLALACELENIDIIQFLIDNGSTIDSVLLDSIKQCNSDIFNYLLEHCVKIDKVNPTTDIDTCKNVVELPNDYITFENILFNGINFV